MKWRQIILSVLVLFSGYHCTKNRPEMVALRDEIAKENSLHGAQVGYAGIESEQWKRYVKLSSLAENKELIALTDDSNPVVRAYAFEALVEKKDPSVYKILFDHLTDNEEVHTFYGCLVGTSKVGDEFFNIARPEVYDEDGNLIHTGILTDEQIDEINDELIFNQKIKLYAKSRLLSKIQPDEKYYDRIREIAVEENDPASLIALARFQRKEDVNLIQERLMDEDFTYHALRAVALFPDEAFYPSLVEIFQQEWAEELYDYPRWRFVIGDLAKYPRPATVELFQMIVSSKDAFRYQTLSTYLYAAIERFPHESYREIKKKIHLDSLHREEAQRWIGESDDQIF